MRSNIRNHRSTKGGMAVRAVHKNWKDSAGLLLISGSYKYARPAVPISKLVDLGKNPLIVSLDQSDSGKEWEVTLVKRSSKTGFYANNYVFPGGRLDKADTSPEWLKLFRLSSGSHIDPFHPILALRDHSHATPLPIYGEVPEGSIQGEIAFRICAVRELFEEAGILLARDRTDVPGIIDCLPGTFPPVVKTLGPGEMQHWRNKVHKNAEEFLNLCSDLQCVPDIWSLFEWSDWLTPRNLHIRYNTVFYICFIDTQPPVTGDGVEIVDAKWYSPSEALRLHANGDILVSPPQFAELNCLRSLGDAPCLHSYALCEVLNGCVYRRTAVRILTKDRVILSLMDPDDLYPAFPEEQAITSPPPHPPQSPTLAHVHLHPSQRPTHEYECPTHTAEELRKMSVQLCRMELHKKQYFFHDTVFTDKITRHLEEYSNYTRKHDNHMTSKL